MYVIDAYCIICPKLAYCMLVHWGQGRHIYISKLTIIGSDNGLLYVLCQAIISNNVMILLFEPLWTSISEIFIKIHTFSFQKMCYKMSPGKWQPFCLSLNTSTHWGRVTHICLSKLNTIGSDNGLSSHWCQAIIWTNAGISLIWPIGTNFNEMLIKILTFSLKKMLLKIQSAKMCPFVSASMC